MWFVFDLWPAYAASLQSRNPRCQTVPSNDQNLRLKRQRLDHRSGWGSYPKAVVCRAALSDIFVALSTILVLASKAVNLGGCSSSSDLMVDVNTSQSSSVVDGIVKRLGREGQFG